MTRLALLTAAVMALASSAPARAQARPTEADVDRAEAAWQAVGLHDYTITLVIHVFAPGSGRPMTFRVLDGEPRRVGPAGDEALPEVVSYNSVERLFAVIRNALAADADELAVDFHPTFGYPVSIELDPRLNATHDGVHMKVLDLRTGPPLPEQADTAPIPSVVSDSTIVNVPVRPGRRTAPVAEFVPAIPAIDADGRCAPAAENDSARRHLAYVFGPHERPVRRIDVAFEGNEVVSYVDNRGDIRPDHDPSITAADPPRSRTVIMIDWRARRGDFANLERRRPVDEIRSTGPDILTATNLGVPSAIVSMIVARCSSSSAP